MAQQQQTPRIHCSQCDGWYASERELKDHMQTAHRRSVPEQSAFQHVETQPGGREDQRDTSKEG
jgi:hypothetical protein